MAAIPNRSSAPATVAVMLFAAALVVLMAWPLLQHVPLYDELLHVLAARGLLATGEPRIDMGFYERALLFTHLVAASIATFGDTLRAARLPSLASAALLAMLLAWWLARRCGTLAALVAAGVLCMLPATTDLAVFVRFYTLHALVVLLMAILAYEALEPGAGTARRVTCLACAVLLLPLGWHLQPTTLVAAGALAAGAVAALAFDHRVALLAQVRRRPWLAAATVAGVIVLVIGGALASGLYHQLRQVPEWAAWAANKPHYYLLELTHETPLLWPLFGVAVVLAWRSQPRLTLFCATAFVAALCVHSIAAAKSPRYVFYALPFFCAVWGIAATQLRTLPHSARLLTGAVLLIALGASTEGQRAARMLLGKADTAALGYAMEADWGPAATRLRTLAAGADRIVTSNSMKALYYIGRYDYELHSSTVLETDTGKDFGIDERTGRAAIATPAALDQVADMPGRTLVVLEQETMGHEGGVTQAVVEELERRCQVQALAAGAGIKAWSCRSQPRG